MTLNHRERIHHQLLEALQNARRHVEYIEAALAHNAAYLGTGVEREGRIAPQSGTAIAPDAFIRYLELVEPEEDISDYLGSEGNEATRPRLGPDAPEHVRPRTRPPVTPLVRLLAQTHPDDGLAFPFKPGSIPAGTYFTDLPEGTKNAPSAAPNPLGEGDPGISRARSATARRGPSAASSYAAPEPLPFAASADSRSPLLVENVPAPHARGPSQKPASHQARRPSAPQAPPLAAGQQPGEHAHTRSDHRPPPQKKGANTPVPGISRPLTDEDCLRAYFALQALDEGVWDWNLRTGSVFLSSRWEAIVGKAPSALSTALDTLTFGLHPEDAETLRAHMAELRQGDRTRLDMGVRFSRADGQAGYGMLRGHCRIEDGRVVRITCVLLDIAESAARVHALRVPAETRVFSSTGNRFVFFDNLEQGFALFEHVDDDKKEGGTRGADDFILLARNPAFSRMYSLDKLTMEKPFLEDVAGIDAEHWRLCLGEVLSQKKGMVHCQYKSGKSGNRIELNAFSPEPGRIACLVKNVTEFYKVEQEIRLNEARLAALHHLSHMDAAPEERVARYSLKEAVRLTGSELGYLYLAAGPGGEEGRVYWSHEGLSQFGKKPAAPHCTVASSSEKAHCRASHGPEMLHAIGEGMGGIFGDSVKIDRYILAPITEEGRVVCVAAVANKKTDYASSDLRQLELFINGMWFHLRRRWAVQDLRKAKEAAEAANLAKDEFLANVSHELRTPLNGILGMLEALQQSPLTDEQREYVNTANYSGRSLLSIITDILDFSRIEAGRLELVSRVFDFAAAVRATLGMFIHEAEKKGILFSSYLSSNIPPALMGDDARVRQILFNIVGNAFKFTSRGEIRVECELLAYRPQSKNCVYIAVHDTGIGIPDDKLGDIFQTFTQLDGSSTRRYGGTGLGLSIVKKLTKLMDGSITVESVAGRGTSVYCTLAFDDPPALGEPAEPSRPAPAAAKSLDLLLVEDDPVNEFTLRTLLRKAGYSSVCVHDGRQAIEAMLLHPFDCVITDIQMPVMDGGELTLRIREGRTADITPGDQVRALLGIKRNEKPKRLAIPRDLPIVALTAHVMEGDREYFLNMGMNYYLSKPVTASDLEALLAQVSLLVQSRRNHFAAKRR